MNNFEYINLLSQSIDNIQSTPEEAGRGLKQFGKMLKDFNKLTHEEKARFWIEAFSDPNNKDACDSFVKRHPECSMGVFIPKE